MKNILAFLFLCLMLACSTNENVDCRTLTVTAEPYRYVVEAVAGEKWNVKTLVPKGGNPETFDPTVGDILALANSKAYFMVGGLGFEDSWKDRISEIHPALRLVDTSQGISRDSGDPHLWTSPDNMLLIAQNVCDALCEMDSIAANEYKARLLLLNEKISATHNELSKRFEALSQPAFMVFHPSLTYFARLYGLQQFAIEEEGKEPSAAHIKNVIDEARRAGVGLVFVQKEFDSKNAMIIAEEIGARVVEINPLSYDWHNELLRIADEMVKN